MMVLHDSIQVILGLIVFFFLIPFTPTSGHVALTSQCVLNVCITVICLYAISSINIGLLQ